jgi:toxin ParE1/3/4
VKVILLPEALADLKAISAFIAEDNPSRARSFSAELRARCASLSKHPRRFPVARDRVGIQIHKLVHGRYLIFYRVLATHVDVMRVIHSARDWVVLFEETDDQGGGGGDLSA